MAWLCLPSLKLVYIVALWFYSTPKWERILGVVLERTHTLWSQVQITPCVVELGLTGLTSTSQNIRTTASSPLRYSGPVVQS